MACIYKIINNKNSKFYIGKTKRNTLTRRWWEHQQKVNDTDYRHPLYDGIRYYGIENFSIEILEECDEKVLDDREKFWIRELSPQYNLTSGGDGGNTFTNKPEHMKEITRQKLSIAAKKNSQNPEYTKKQSIATKKRWENETYRNKMIKMAIELGKTPEHRKKLSATVKKAIETKKDIWSDCKKGNKNGRWLGSIEMYDPDGNLYKVYETAVECKKDTGVVAHNIRTKARTGEPVMRGKFKGYTFKIKNGTYDT